MSKKVLLQGVSDDVRHAGYNVATNKFPSAANVLIVCKSVIVVADKSIKSVTLL